MRINTGYVVYLLTSLFFTIAFIWLFIQGADWQEIIRIAQASKIPYLLISLLALASGFYIRIWRWTHILKKHNAEVTKAKCAVPCLSAFALNNLLPFRLGDVARITLFNKQLGADYATVTSSLLVERILDFVSLLIIFCACFVYLDTSRIQGPVVNYIFMVSVVAVVVICIFLGFSGQVTGCLKNLHQRTLDRQMTLAAKILHFLATTAASIYLHSTRRSVMVLLAASLLLWMTEASLFWLIAKSTGISLAVMESFYVMSLSTLSTLLPSTPGYVGTFHYLCRLAMEQTGVAPNSAIVFSVLVHMIIIVPVTIIGGAAFIHRFGNTWKNKISTSLQKTLER